MQKTTGFIGLAIAALSWVCLGANDGLNVDANQNLLIEDCFASGGDDPLCMKSATLGDGTPPPETRNNTTCNTVIYTKGYNGPQIGQEMAGDMVNTVYRNIYPVNVGSSRIALGYRVQTGKKLSNTLFENLYGESNGNFSISSYYNGTGSSIDGVTIKNMQLNSASLFSIAGHAEGDIRNVTIKNLFLKKKLISDISSLTVREYVSGVSVQTSAVVVRIVHPVDYQVVSDAASLPIRAHTQQTTGTASVKRVEFYFNGSKIGEDATAPYALEWKPTGDGIGLLQALAYTDNNPLPDTSAPVPLRVRTTPVLDSLRIFPDTVFLEPSTSFQFGGYGYDQYGRLLAAKPTLQWSVSGAATISSAGMVSLQGGANELTVQLTATLNGKTMKAYAYAKVVEKPQVYDFKHNSQSDYTWTVATNNKLKLYVDKEKTTTNMPARYLGMPFLQTAAADFLNPLFFAAFKVSHPVKIVVAMQTTVDQFYPWFEEYTKTGESFSTAGGTFNLYYRDYAAHETVYLGPKGKSTTGGMYAVMVQHGDGVVATSPVATTTRPTAVSMALRSNKVLSIANLDASVLSWITIVDLQGKSLLNRAFIGRTEYEVALPHHAQGFIVVKIESNGSSSTVNKYFVSGK